MAGVFGSSIGPPALPRGRPAGDRRSPARGFTLLELIVVLLLLGLVTALAMPGLERLSASIARTSERDHILDQFAGLGREAMLQGRSYVVFGSGEAPEAGSAEGEREGADAAPDGDRDAAPSYAGHEHYGIDLPEGWEIHLDPPLVVRANGICLGTELTLRHLEAEEFRVDLEPPYCRIDADA